MNEWKKWEKIRIGKWDAMMMKKQNIVNQYELYGKPKYLPCLHNIFSGLTGGFFEKSFCNHYKIVIITILQWIHICNHYNLLHNTYSAQTLDTTMFQTISNVFPYNYCKLLCKHNIYTYYVMYIIHFPDHFIHFIT